MVAEALEIPDALIRPSIVKALNESDIESEGRGRIKTRRRYESEYDNDWSFYRNVRQRVGGGANKGVDVDFNADSRGTSYSEDDAKLAKAIEVLFGKLNSLKLKRKLCFTLRDV